jgi:hypothetical protein
MTNDEMNFIFPLDAFSWKSMQRILHEVGGTIVGSGKADMRNVKTLKREAIIAPG